MQKTNVYTRIPFFYGWIILGLTFIALFASFGIRVSFGGYVTSWENEFSISRTAVTMISMLSFLVLAVSQPLIGKLNDRFGARVVLTGSMLLAGVALLLCSVAQSLWQLAVLYGIILAFALTGASNITSTALIARWFNANRGLALGIVTSGMAVGQLTVVPLSYYFITNYDWRITTAVIGLIVLAVFMPLMALLVRSKPADIGLLPFGATNTVKGADVQSEAKGNIPSVWTILRQRVFWQLSIPYFFCGFTDVGLVDTHYIPFAEGQGFSFGVITFTFSLIAVANFFGTIGTGYLADRWNRSRLLAFIYGVRAVTFVFVLIANNFWLLVIFAVVYGLTEMASIAPTSAITADLFQNYSLGVIYGFVSVSHQLGGAIGSLVPGIVYDVFHSYMPVFIFSAVLMVFSALIVSRVPGHLRSTNDEFTS